MLARLVDEAAHRGVAGDETLEHRQLDPRLSWHCFARRAGAQLLCLRLDVCPNEPATEPAGSHFVHRPCRAGAKRFSDRSNVDLVAEAQVLEALPDAPTFRERFPVELIHRQVFREATSSR